jgi:hypothetical protein
MFFVLFFSTWYLLLLGVINKTSHRNSSDPNSLDPAHQVSCGKVLKKALIAVKKVLKIVKKVLKFV